MAPVTPRRHRPIPTTGKPGVTTDGGGASYPFGSFAGTGEASKGPSAPGVAEDAVAAAEGGPQPEADPAPALAGPAPRVRRRLRLTEQRPHVRGVRLSEAELAAVKAAAAANGLTVSGFLSMAAVAAARDQAPGAYIADEHARIRELFLARRHLAHVGNNLNQIARALNAGAPDPPHTTAVLRAVAAAIARVDTAVNQLIHR